MLLSNLVSTYQDITYVTKEQLVSAENLYIINRYVGHVFGRTRVEHVFVNLLASKHVVFE